MIGNADVDKVEFLLQHLMVVSEGLCYSELFRGLFEDLGIEIRNGNYAGFFRLDYSRDVASLGNWAATYYPYPQRFAAHFRIFLITVSTT